MDQPATGQCSTVGRLVGSSRHGAAPLEVITMILEYLDDSYEKDVETLRAVSYVSWVWKSAAQAILFRFIDITNGEDCRFWSKKFRQFPHLGHHVGTLYFSDPNDVCLERAYLRGRNAKSLISSLPRVRRLFLMDIVRWGPVELRLMKGLSQSVRALHVAGVLGMSRRKDLPELLYALPNVDDFSFWVTGEDKYSEDRLVSLHSVGMGMRKSLPLPQVTGESEPRRLQKLGLFDAHISVELILWLTGPAFDLSKLCSLSLSWYRFMEFNPPDGFFEPLDELIRLVGGQITNLKLALPDHCQLVCRPSKRWVDLKNVLTEHFINTPILRHFTSLKTLTITPDEKGKNTFVSDLYTSNAKFIVQALSGSAHTLEKIEIKARLSAGYVERVKNSFRRKQRSGTGLGLFDGLFAEEGAYPALRVLEFEFFVVPFFDPGEKGLPMWEEVADVLRRCLKKSISKKTVKMILCHRGGIIPPLNGTGILTTTVVS